MMKKLINVFLHVHKVLLLKHLQEIFVEKIFALHHSKIVKSVVMETAFHVIKDFICKIIIVLALAIQG